VVKISLRVCLPNNHLDQKLFHKNISKPNRPLLSDLILIRPGRPENIDSTIPRFNPKLIENRDLNQNKIKNKKITKIIKFSYENISNTKKNEEQWRTFKFKPNNINIKSEKISSKKKKSKVLCAIKHKSGIKGLFASIIFKLTWFLSKEGFSLKPNPKIETLKNMLLMQNNLDYWLIMMYKHAKTKTNLKRNLKLVLKIVFFRWIWRTWIETA